MAKKPTKKTPCEQGPELLPWELPVAKTSAIDFGAWVCFASARVVLKLEAVPMGPAVVLMDETGKSEMKVRLPTLAAGRYELFWSIQTPSAKWQTRAELTIDGVTRFRRLKDSDGANPVNMGALGLVVQS